MDSKERLETACLLLNEKGMEMIADSAREMALSREKGTLKWLTESDISRLGSEISKAYKRGYWKGYWIGAAIAITGAVIGVYVHDRKLEKRKLKAEYEEMLEKVEESL